MREWWEAHDRLWVCPDTPDVLDRLAGERVVRSYSPTTRNLPNLLRNSALALRLLLRERPSLLVSAGAGVAVPFFVAAWLLRIPTVFIEVYDRVDTPDDDRAALRAVHDAAHRAVAEPARVLPRRQPRGAAPVTPLVVALAGTDHHPFDRLVDVGRRGGGPPARRAVPRPARRRPPGAPVVAEGQEFLTHDRLVELLAEATAVVCHGGPGTIMDAREAGHVPLCVPRDPRARRARRRAPAAVRRAGRAGRRRAHVATLEAFHRGLDRALAHAPSQGAAAMATRARDTARARLAAELDDADARCVRTGWPGASAPPL